MEASCLWQVTLPCAVLEAGLSLTVLTAGIALLTHNNPWGS